MKLQPSEVTAILKKEIASYDDSLQVESVGSVIQVGDGVARIHGLDNCMMSELLQFPGDVRGVALNLEQDNVGAILLGPEQKIKEGDVVKSTGEIISVPVGEAMLGRVVNALGQPVDGKGPIATTETVATAIAKMSRGGYRRLPIVSEDGQPQGFIKVASILNFLVGHFPSLVYNLPPEPHHKTETREGA